MKRVRVTLATAAIAAAVLALGACLPGPTTGGPAIEGTSIEGTWSGAVAGSYLCEMDAESIELTFEEDTVVVTGGSVTEGAYPSIAPGSSGTYEQNDDGRFVFSVDDGGELKGSIIVDPEAGHAVLILDGNPPSDGNQGGYIGVLQLGSLQSISTTESDIVGTWSGTGVAVNGAYDLIESVDTEMTISEPEGLALTGNYGSSSVSIAAGDLAVYSSETGIFRTTGAGVTLGASTYPSVFALSYDEQWLAAGFFTEGCSTDLFDQLQDQKFALYERQP